MRVVFIARTFPPVIGGIENQNCELVEHLAQHVDLTLIANRKGRPFLPIFLPYSCLVSLFRLHKTDLVILGDGVSALTAWFIRRFSNKPILCILHGLDITWPNKYYQALWVRSFFKSVDRFVAVSHSTKALAVHHGIHDERITIINNGAEFWTGGYSSKEAVSKTLSVDLNGKFILLTVGRLIERKGVKWFVQHVIPKLDANTIYLVAGNGPEYDRIKDCIEQNGLADQVHLLGEVTEEIKHSLYGISDIFIQPNIPVKSDVEGFGISIIEAGLTGLPTVASRMDGIVDAVCDGENGYFAEPLDANSFIAKIQQCSDQLSLERKSFRDRIQTYCNEHHNWKIITSKYIETINQCLAGKGHQPGFAPVTNRISKAKKIIKVVGQQLDTKSRRLRILDIGTGNGEIAAYIGRHHDVTSIDIHDHRAATCHYDFCLSAEALPFKDRYFDVVISNHVVEHLKDQRLHTSELLRVVKDSGCIYLATPNRHWPYEVHYRLPFLHYLPYKYFIRTLKLVGVYKEEVRLLSLRELIDLFPSAITTSCSGQIIHDPEAFDMKAPRFISALTRLLSKERIESLTFIHPTFVFLITK